VKADTIRLDFFNAALRAIDFITDGEDDFTLAEAKAFGESPDFDQAHGDLKTHMVDVGNFDPEEADTDARHILLMEKTFTSFGDLMLKATTGTITEMIPEDSEVDIIADEAILEAENGIHGIELAVNSLTVETNHGAIGLMEKDGFGERLAGMTINSAMSGDGLIDITAIGSLEVAWASAEDPSGNVRLASIQGNLVVLKPDSGDAILAGEGITLIAGQMIILKGPVSAPSLLEFRAGTGVVFLVEESLTISADTIIIESGQSITIDGTLSASELVELISNRGNIKVTGEIIGKNGGELKQLSLIARGNMVIEGALKGYFEYRSNGQTYYMDHEGRVYDHGLNEVSDAEDLDLRPVLQKEYKQVYDEHTGMAMYQDPNNLGTGVHYYLNLGNEIFYLLQDMETGLWTYRGVEQGSPQVFYSESQVLETDASGNILTTIYGSDKVTPVSNPDALNLSPLYTEITDQGLIDSLQPVLSELPTGGIIVNEETITTASELLRLHAQYELNGVGSNLAVTGENGEIDIATGGDIFFDSTIKANRRVTLTSTGYISLEGQALGGDVTINGTITGNDPTSPVKEIALEALENLSLNADLHADQRIEINAGGRLILQSRTLRAEGTDGTIDILGGSDLTISDSILSAASLIEIDAGGDVYIDTTTLSSNSPAGAVHIHAGNALVLSDNILIEAPQQIALGSDGEGLWLETVHLLGLNGAKAETITIETGGDLGIHTSTLSAIQSIILTAGANLTAEDSILKALGTPGTIQLTSGGTTDLTGVTMEATLGIQLEGIDNVNFQNSSLSATEEIYIKTLEGVVSQTGQGTILTNHLHAEANAGITLNTQVQDVVAKVYGPGDIVIAEADAVVLIDLLTAAGSIEVTAEATITALLVESLTDHDVILAAVAEDVLIDYVGTGKTAGQIFVEAGNGSIREVEEVDPIDANSEVDVRGHYGHLKALYAVGSSSDSKLNLEFDLKFVEIEGQDFVVDIDGDIEINVDLQGIANVKATGTITVTHLTAQGEYVRLDAGDDILIDYLELGNDGEVFLTASGRILEVLDSDDPDEEVDLIASTANLFAGLDIGDETDAARNLETAIVALQAESTTGSIFINESDDLDLTAIDALGGGIKVSAGGGLTLLGDVTAAQSTILEAGQAIVTEPTATLTSISLLARAVTGITLNTQVEEATLEVTGRFYQHHHRRYSCRG
jgi:hypothetical protein